MPATPAQPNASDGDMSHVTIAETNRAPPRGRLDCRRHRAPHFQWLAIRDTVISVIQSCHFSCLIFIFTLYLLFLGQKCKIFFGVKSGPSEILFGTPQSILRHIF
jgi:hypothetical protein